MSNCLNCGQELTNHYCASCGQKATVSRYSLKSFLHDVYNSILHFDSDFIRTVYALSSHPGRFIRDYLLGKRRHFVSPFKYLFIVLTLNIAATLILQKPALEPVKFEGREGVLVHQIVTILTNLMVILLMLFWAAGMRLVDRKKENTFIEYYCFLLYIGSQSILIFIVIQSILKPFGWLLMEKMEGLAWMIIFTLLYAWGAFGFYQGRGSVKSLRVLNGFLAGAILLICVRFILSFIIGIWL